MTFPFQKPSRRSQLLDAHFAMLSAADLGEEGAKVLAIERCDKNGGLA